MVTSVHNTLMTKSKATTAVLDPQTTEDNWGQEAQAPVTTDTQDVPTASVVTESTLSEALGEEDNEEVSPSEALTGQALLDLVRDCGESTPREELIRLAGYTKKVKDGSTRLMYTNFMEALLEAQGTKIGVKTTTSQAKGGRMGHPLSFLTRVHFNGNIMVGRAYVAMLPTHDKGAEFQVVVSPESNPGGINLVPVND